MANQRSLIAFEEVPGILANGEKRGGMIFLGKLLASGPQDVPHSKAQKIYPHKHQNG